MAEPEAEIVALIAKKTGLEASAIHPDSRLAQDLGMDGDDAAEFFEDFGAKFHVDLSMLANHWGEHFHGEVRAMTPGCVAVICVSAAGGGLLHSIFDTLPVWAVVLANLAVLGWVYNRFFAKPDVSKLAITVRDLVEAARSGKWIIHSPKPAAPEK